MKDEMERRFVADLMAEHARALAKFPGPNVNLAALTEEAGELSDTLCSYLLALQGNQGRLARAMLHRRPNDGNDSTWADVRKEAIQVAVMAMRVALEGDPSIATPVADEASAGSQFCPQMYFLNFPTGSWRASPNGNAWDLERQTMLAVSEGHSAQWSPVLDGVGVLQIMAAVMNIRLPAERMKDRATAFKIVDEAEDLQHQIDAAASLRKDNAYRQRLQDERDQAGGTPPAPASSSPQPLPGFTPPFAPAAAPGGPVIVATTFAPVLPPVPPAATPAPADFDPDAHAINNAISCLEALMQHYEIPSGGEQTGNIGHIADAASWLRQLRDKPEMTVRPVSGTCKITPRTGSENWDVHQWNGKRWTQIAGDMSAAFARGVYERRMKEAGLESPGEIDMATGTPAANPDLRKGVIKQLRNVIHANRKNAQIIIDQTDEGVQPNLDKIRQCAKAILENA
jgi:hypothetical protein